MSIKVDRILFRIGEDSIAVTLPKSWIRYYRLKAGDSVEIIAGDNVLIIRVPDGGCKAKEEIPAFNN